MSTIFQKIIDGQIPAKKVFENERIFAFHDISPQAPVHLLIVPKKPITSLSEVTTEDAPLLGEILIVAKQLADEFGITNDFRLISNCGERAGQSVLHLHFHLIGGKQLGALV